MSIHDAVFIIAGWVTNKDWSGSVTTIARFKDEKWNKVGDLKTPRSGAKAVKYGPVYMIIGGWSGSDP